MSALSLLRQMAAAERRRLAPRGRALQPLVLLLVLLAKPGAAGITFDVDGGSSGSLANFTDSPAPPPAAGAEPLLLPVEAPATGSALPASLEPEALATPLQTAGALAAGPRVAALLPPGQSMRLMPNDFDEDGQVCTEAEVLRATFPAFSLPTDGQHFALLLHLTSLDCSGAGGGALLGLGAASLSLGCSAEGQPAELVLAAPDGSAGTRFTLPPGSSTSGSSSSDTVLTLSLDRQQRSFAVCVNGQLLLPAGSGGGAGSAALLQTLGSLSPAELVGSAVVLGARSDAEPAARVQVAAAYAVDFAIPCDSTAPGEAQAGLLSLLADAAAAWSGRAADAAPGLAIELQPSGDATVGQEIQLGCTVTPANADDAFRLRLTLFGLTPPGCTAAECGDFVVESSGAPAPGQPARLDVTAVYPKAGRYIARLEVCVWQGRDQAFFAHLQGGRALKLMHKSPPCEPRPVPCFSALCQSGRQPPPKWIIPLAMVWAGDQRARLGGHSGPLAHSQKGRGPWQRVPL
ncbi:hypothetical protein ABPG75_011636 [Micractinium tetrahymenae]